MEKIDLKKELKELYNTGKKATTPHLVTCPPASYLMADGHGDPNTSKEFQSITGIR